jgi:hypothetical protein
MDHDVAALEDRIARLEQELEDVRTRPEHRPAATASLWSWWERHGRRVLFTLTLVAVAAPTAVWMQARHEERMLAAAQRHEAKLVRNEGMLQHRHERTLVYLDTAVNADEADPRRIAALRYLAENASKRSWGRWAKDELKRAGAHEAPSCQPRPKRRGCGQ